MTYVTDCHFLEQCWCTQYLACPRVPLTAGRPARGRWCMPFRWSSSAAIWASVGCSGSGCLTARPPTDRLADAVVRGRRGAPPRPDGRRATSTGRTCCWPAVLQPARGAPPPDRVSTAEVERHALPGWLATSEPLGEWTLRAAGGGSPAGPTPVTPSAIRACRSGQPPTGWSNTPRGTASRRWPGGQRLRRGAGSAQPRLGGHLRSRPRTCRSAGRPAERPPVPGGRTAHEELTTPGGDALPAEPAATMPIPPCSGRSWTATRPGPSARAGEQIFAIARGHLSEDWLGLVAVWADPDHRRSGRATATDDGVWGTGPPAAAPLRVLQADRENQPAASHLPAARLRATTTATSTCAALTTRRQFGSDAP